MTDSVRVNEDGVPDSDFTSGDLRINERAEKDLLMSALRVLLQTEGQVENESPQGVVFSDAGATSMKLQHQLREALWVAAPGKENHTIEGFRDVDGHPTIWVRTTGATGYKVPNNLRKYLTETTITVVPTPEGTDPNRMALTGREMQRVAAWTRVLSESRGDERIEQCIPLRMGYLEDSEADATLTGWLEALVDCSVGPGSRRVRSLTPEGERLSDLVGLLMDSYLGRNSDEVEKWRPVLEVLAEKILPGWTTTVTSDQQQMAQWLYGYPEPPRTKQYQAVYSVPARMATKIGEMVDAGWPPLLPHWIGPNKHCWNGPIYGRCGGENLKRPGTILLVTRAQGAVVRATRNRFALDIVGRPSQYKTPVSDEWLAAYERACDNLCSGSVTPDQIGEGGNLMIAAAQDVPVVLTDVQGEVFNWWSGPLELGCCPATLNDRGEFDPRELRRVRVEETRLREAAIEQAAELVETSE